MSDLDDRVTKFLMLELPGQPQMMHMGTSQLVNDLDREVRRLRTQKSQLREALQIAVKDGPAGYEEWLDSSKNVLQETEEDDE